MEIYFHLNLKYLRLNKNVSREDFVALFGMTLTNLSKWEKGRHLPKVDDLVKVAHYFEVSIDDLLLKNMSKLQDEIGEKNETYATKSEQNSLQIKELQQRMAEVERVLEIKKST